MTYFNNASDDMILELENHILKTEQLNKIFIFYFDLSESLIATKLRKHTFLVEKQGVLHKAFNYSLNFIVKFLLYFRFLWV